MPTTDLDLAHYVAETFHDPLEFVLRCFPWGQPNAPPMIRDNAGQHFDPALAQLFLDHADDVQDVLAKYGDPVQTLAHPGETTAAAIAATRKLHVDAPATEQTPMYGGNATPNGLVRDLGATALRSERLLWSGAKSHRSVTWHR